MKRQPSPLDPFIPHPDVRERFETTIGAPAAVVMSTAAEFDLQSPLLVRFIVRLRERLMRASPHEKRQPVGLLDEMRSLGWGPLDEQAGRHAVYGASCQPWLADVEFTPIAPERFADHAEPGRVKIAWTLEAEPLTPAKTRFAQETRVVATDDVARARFRRYWRWARLGVVAIRLLLLPAIRRAAERRWASERTR